MFFANASGVYPARYNFAPLLRTEIDAPVGLLQNPSPMKVVYGENIADIKKYKYNNGSNVE